VLNTWLLVLCCPAEDHKPAQPDERARIMAAGGFLSEIGGITRVNGECWGLLGQPGL